MCHRAPLALGQGKVDRRQSFDHFSRLGTEVRAVATPQQFTLNVGVLREILLINDVFGYPFPKFFTIVHTLYPLAALRTATGAENRLRKRSTTRNRVFFTVPTAIPIVFAISSQVIPS